MGTRLLCCVALCLLGAGHTGAGVLQSPRHKVTKRGWYVDLRCDPISGHAGLYWYRQAVGQGPEFLVSFLNKDKVDSSGMPSNDRFQVNRSEGSYSILRIQRQQFHDYTSELHVSSLEPTDSAVYLCASSLAQPCRVTSLLCTNLPACSNSDRAHRLPRRVHSFQGAFQSFRRPFLHPPELRARPTQNPGSRACTRTEHFHICPHSTRRLSSPG
ncbi:Hypothetical predicted protein [Lynx pardinus]|uniref:Ig-like domain-containing protein n=1 Tax=Lynx pardinus TaxID=191816 RepID=A0A485NME8_LYNPA|nr:Hypothetical predicted protein [Lynx pardinus]